MREKYEYQVLNNEMIKQKLIGDMTRETEWKTKKMRQLIDK